MIHVWAHISSLIYTLCWTLAVKRNYWLSSKKSSILLYFIDVCNNFLLMILKAKNKTLRCLVSALVTSDPRVSFEKKDFCYETMSNCNQNCWIDWDSDVLCFKRLFQIGVWAFAGFVWPLLATILCVWVYMYYVFQWLPKKKRLPPTKKSLLLHQFWSQPKTRNWRLFLA